MRIVTTMPKTAAKRACYTCGAGMRDRYWHTPAHIYAEGDLVICDQCLINAAVALGMLPADKVDELQTRARSLQEANDKLMEVAGKHSGLVSALQTAGVEVAG